MVEEKPVYRWWVLATSVLVFTFTFGMGWTYIVMVVPQVRADLNISLADWGSLWSAVAFGTTLAAILGGALGDRFGIQRTVGLGVVLMGTTLLLRATASGFPSMYVWMFLFGVALALTFPNVPKALGMWFPPQELGLANGVTQAGYGMGGALATVLTPLVIGALGGWRNLTYVLGFVSITLGVLWFMTVKDRTPDEPPADGPDTTDAEQSGPGALAAIQQVLRIRDVWLLAICYMFFLGGYIGIIGYAPTYFVEEQDMTPTASGFVLSLLMWAFVVGSLVLPALSDRVGLRKIFYIPGMLLTGICMVLAAYATGVSLWIVAIMWGLLGGVAPIAFVVPLEMERVGPILAGSAVGVALTAGYLGGMLSPIIGMSLVERTPLAGFVFWGGCYALSGILFLGLKETGLRATSETDHETDETHAQEAGYDDKSSGIGSLS